MHSLVQPLFDGPLDIVGDVHGEIDALESLLARLGYDAAGRHAAGRRLVFLGDLTDRGPDSPAVVARVRSLVEAGLAQCVLGNHDLNILLGDEKLDNDWFFGRPFHAPDGAVVPQVLADDASRAAVTRFFRTLPLALERPDIRVVHACWLPKMIDIARAATSTVELEKAHRSRIDEQIAHLGWDKHECALAHQNQNPVKVLTSGLEHRLPERHAVHGKRRMLARTRWWETYNQAPFCVFGHYSLLYSQERRGRAICIDFGVARRWTERPHRGGEFCHKLAALRFPEREIMFDDGTPSIWQ